MADNFLVMQNSMNDIILEIYTQLKSQGVGNKLSVISDIKPEEIIFTVKYNWEELEGRYSIILNGTDITYRLNYENPVKFQYSNPNFAKEIASIISKRIHHKIIQKGLLTLCGPSLALVEKHEAELDKILHLIHGWTIGSENKSELTDFRI